ncbi:MAG: hypothetical protein ABIT37_10620 [Luteolibacter sp.]
MGILWPLVLLGKFLYNSEKAKKALAVLLAIILWAAGVIQHCISDVVSSFAGMIASINTTAFRNVSFSSVEYVGYVNAFIPVSEFIGLFTIYLTIWGTVILLRWIKSFVPTLAN